MAKYKSLFELYKAMEKGEVSKKNRIFIDNDYLECSLYYDVEGNEIEEDPEELYRGGFPEKELATFLEDLGLTIEWA
jgi:hypothetical protein